MTLTQLRSFIAVAQYNGFTAAARALKTSQTTITSQIQGLEEDHGIRLFERRGRRIDLTQAGQDLLPVARQMIALEDEAGMMLKDSGLLRRGALSIGAVSPFQVIAMIGSFTARYPDIKVSMALGNSESILNSLDTYACDVGIVANTSSGDRFHMQHHASHPVIAFVRRDHRLATLPSVELAELARHPLLTREAGSTTRRALEDAMEAIGATPRSAMEIGSREAIREAVIRGLGVGTVSQSEYVADPQLHPLPIAGARVETRFYLCCLKERRRTRLISAFFDAVPRQNEQGRLQSG